MKIRKGVAAMWRGVLGIGRLSIAWIPALTLLIMAGIYLLNCLMVLAAPGTGFELTYLGRGGAIKIEAESYAVDPIRQTLNAFGLKMTDAEGNRIGSAERLHVERRSGSVFASVNGLNLFLVRRKDGSLSALDLLPPDDPNAKPQAFFLTVDRAKVRLVDKTQTTPIEDRFDLTGLDITTDGSKTFVSASLNWESVLESQIRGQIDTKNNFDITASQLRADIVRARPTIERWVDANALKNIQAWNADSLNLDGEIKLTGTENGVATARGDLAIVGDSLKARGILADADLIGKVNFINETATITARLEEPGRVITWDGPVSWANELAGQGEVTIQLADSKRSWNFVSNSLPKELQLFGSQFSGIVGFQANKFSVTGDVSAQNANIAGESFKGVLGNVIADQDRLSLVIDQTDWRSARVKGWLTADYKGKFLTGLFETLGDGLVRIEVPLDSGKIVLAAKSRALITGSPQKPEVLVDVTGFAQLGLENKSILLGEVDSRIEWKNGLAQFDRAVLSGPNGVVNLNGNINTTTRQLNLELEAAGIDLTAANDVISGVGYGTGRITGSVSDPQVILDATVVNVNVGTYTIPKISALISLRESEVLASQINANYGLGSVTGQATYSLNNGTIGGLLKAQDVFIADLFPDLPIIGKINAERIQLGGSLVNPEVEFVADGQNILLSGVEVDQFAMSGKANKDQVTLSSSSATIGSGSLNASGTYSLLDQLGRFEYEAIEIPLNRLPVDQELLDIRGTASGVGVFQTDEVGEWVATNDIQLTGVRVNDFDAGSGILNVNLANKLIQISGGLSSLNGLLEVPEAKYSIANGDAEGTFYITNLEIEGVVRALARQIKLTDIQSERIVRDLEGLLSAEITVTRQNEKMAAKVTSLTASNLVSLGRDLGVVSLSGTGSENDLSVENLRWTIPGASEGEQESIAEIKGNWKRVDESDLVDASGRLVAFDPYVLNLFMQDAPEFHARLNAEFVLGGTSQDLNGQASLSADSFQVPDESGNLVSIPASLNFGSIDFVNNQISALGKLKYQGIEGDVSASVPLSAFDENPTSSVEAQVELSPRPISSLERYIYGLDFERTSGQVMGAITFSGNRLGYSLSGSASYAGQDGNPAQLAFKDSNTILKNTDIQLNSDGKKISLNARAESSLGGDVQVSGDVNLIQFLQGKLDISALKAAAIENASVQFNNFKLSEKIRLANPSAAEGEPPIIEASSPTVGELNGQISVSGVLEKPIISGEVLANNLNVSLPSTFPAGSQSGNSEFDPEFRDFRLVALPGSIVNIPTGNIKVSGVTILNGELSAVDIRAPFTVESGTLNLPASRVTLEEGTVLVTAGFGGDPRAEIDLQGWTVVTVRRTSDQYQTYRLNLEVQGNLLDPDGVRINGSSDPPDLSIEEIRAIVGQRDFIQSLLDTAFGNSDRRQGITESIFTLAIPTLTQQFTGSIAEALDLDYLVLDYNPFDGGIVRGGKEVFKGLMLEGSRQISPQNNQPIKFEVRLSYRPPTKDAFLSRFRISAGVTEAVPWKVGITWTTRF